MRRLIINNICYFIIRIIILLFSLSLIFCVVLFSNPNGHIGKYIVYNFFYPNNKSIEWWIYLLVYFMIISILIVFILLIMSLYFTYKKNRLQAIKRKNEILITEIIIGYIYADHSTERISIEESYSSLRKVLKNKIVIETFFTIIIRIQEIIDKDLSEKYNVLVEKLELKQKIIFFLYSEKLSEKIIALKIISCLKMEGFEPVISRYSGGTNYVLRSVALATLIRLSETNHLSRLLSHKHYISMLDINVIISEVEKNRKTDIDYLSLVRSQSPRIIAIGLFLIKSRNKTEYKELIKPLLEVKDTLLSEVAWETFISFATREEDITFMTEKFEFETFSNKLLIVRGLKFYHENESLFSFIDKIIKDEGILLKIEALKILYENDIKRFISYNGSSDKNIASAYNELVDLNLD